MKKILVVDFDDSFTHNLSGLFFSLGHQVNLIHWTQFNQTKMDFDLVVLGPGPGHPDEYISVSKVLSRFEDSSILGVCLGHQILLKHLGFELRQLTEPLHGVSLDLPEVASSFGIPNFCAQFYNSWSIKPYSGNNKEVKTLVNGEMTVLFTWKKWLGVQFHPESVGTTCPEAFMERLLREVGV